MAYAPFIQNDVFVITIGVYEYVIEKCTEKNPDLDAPCVVSKTAFNIALHTIFTAFPPSRIHCGCFASILDLRGGGKGEFLLSCFQNFHRGLYSYNYPVL